MPSNKTAENHAKLSSIFFHSWLPREPLRVLLGRVFGLFAGFVQTLLL
jgi:hypothetical protein